VGFALGAGAEFALNEYLGIFAVLGYSYIPLRSDAFIYENKEADYHDFSIRIGARLSFLKSKEL
jgi:opacity protein-like surface antigen